jgi:hypothetical protein
VGREQGRRQEGKRWPPGPGWEPARGGRELERRREAKHWPSPLPNRLFFDAPIRYTGSIVILRLLTISFFLFLQAHAYQNNGTKLGVLKSANESLTRVVVYVSLMALYILGGRKVNAVSNRFICI